MSTKFEPRRANPGARIQFIEAGKERVLRAEERPDLGEGYWTVTPTSAAGEVVLDRMGLAHARKAEAAAATQDSGQKASKRSDR